MATLSGGLPELWRDGSLLCALINSAIPGACPNPHRHWRKPPSHSQTIAFKYLAVQPVFSDTDFEEKTLTIPQEQKFIRYLLTLQQAMMKLNNRTENHPQTCSSHYIARGMGLVTGTQNRNTIFYIYSTSKSALAKDIIVKIRGPYSSYATVTIPAFRNSNLKQINNKRKLIFESKQRKSFLKSISMDFMNTEKGDDVIPMKIEMESDRAVVGFVPKYTGMYQIVLMTNNEHLAGSPYNLRILSDDSDYDSDCKNTPKNKTKDDDVELCFESKIKGIMIPDTGYKFKINNKYDSDTKKTKQETNLPFNSKTRNVTKDLDKIKANEISERKQFFEKKNETDSESNQIKDNFESNKKTLCNLNSIKANKENLVEQENKTIQFRDSTKQTLEEGVVMFLANKIESVVLPNSGNKNLPEKKKFIKQSVEISPEIPASSICEKHIVSEDKSGDIELSTFSVKENLVEEDKITKINSFEWNGTIKEPKKIKAFIKEKKDYWDHLILTNTKNPKANALMFSSKSLESLNKKCDFDFSLDKSVEDLEIPSVNERKLVLIEQLTDEQKLLQMQTEKKLKDLENKQKPKRCESFNSVFSNGKY